MSQAPRQHLRIETVGEVAVVLFIDSKLVDDEILQGVGAQLYSLVEDGGYSQLLLNFRSIQYMSSEMLGKLLGLQKRVAQVRGRLKLCCVNPDLLQVFRITKLDRSFEIHASEQAALDSY